VEFSSETAEFINIFLYRNSILNSFRRGTTIKPDILLFHPPKNFSFYNLPELIKPDQPADTSIKYLSIGYRLLYLTAYLKERGYKTECWNIPLAYHQGYDNQSILRIIKPNYPLLIGIDLSAPPQIMGSIALAKFLKKQFPNTPIFMNGMLPSLFREEILKSCDSIDILIPGESEKVVIEICDAIERKKEYTDITGTIVRNNGKFIKNEGKNIVKDIDQIPPYSVDCLMPKFLNLENRAIINTCSGPCKYDCIYCVRANSCYSLSPRSKMEFHSIKWITEQFEILLNHTDRFSIEDHCSCNPKFINKLTETIKKEGLDERIKFLNVTVIPSESINQKTLEDFNAAGINSIDLGIESGSDRLLTFLNRPYNIKQVADITKKAIKNDIITKTYWMVTGFEEKNDLNATRKLLKNTIKTGAVPFLSVLALFPRTQLYDNPDNFKVTLNFSTFEDYQAFSKNTRFKRRKTTHKTDIMNVKDMEKALNGFKSVLENHKKDIKKNLQNFRRILRN